MAEEIERVILEKKIIRKIYYGPRTAIKEWWRLRAIHRQFDRTITWSYRGHPENELSQLSQSYGSDKSSNSLRGHTYTDFYALLLEHRRASTRNVLECGIGTTNPKIASNMGPDGVPGASLRMWRDYFPNARIVGVDIDESVLFESNRIETYLMDQTDTQSVKAFLNSLGERRFDLIIDDGLHTFDAAIHFFEHLFERLESDGLFVIEDVHSRDLSRYVHYFHSRSDEFDLQCVRFQRAGRSLGSNVLLMIRAKKPHEPTPT